MKWLQGTWARRFNRFRGQTGRPFQGRFKSLVIEDGEGFRRVCDYIHLNPVRAHVVPANEVVMYRRSSLWHFVAGKSPEWLDGEGLLQTSGLRPGKAGWLAYATRLGVLMGDKESREKLTSKQLSRGWCIGSKEFRKTLQASLREQLSQWRERRFVGLEPDAIKEERATAWEEALHGYARAAGVELDKLPAKKSADEKVLLAAAMKMTTSVSNGWLAERLGMGQPASVSQFVRRWSGDAKKSALIRRLLSKAKA